MTTLEREQMTDFEFQEHLAQCTVESPCPYCKRQANCKMCGEYKAEKCGGTLCLGCWHDAEDMSGEVEHE